MALRAFSPPEGQESPRGGENSSADLRREEHSGTMEQPVDVAARDIVPSQDAPGAVQECVASTQEDLDRCFDIFTFKQGRVSIIE